jgi:hypothetical protein
MPYRKIVPLLLAAAAAAVAGLGLASATGNQKMGRLRESRIAHWGNFRRILNVSGAPVPPG